MVRREKEETFSSALLKNPRDAFTRAAYARWLAAAERNEEAEMEHRAAVETAPANASMRADFAELLAVRGNLAEAELQYEEGLRRQPDSARLRSSYARFLVVRKSDSNTALEQYELGAQLCVPSDDPANFAEMLAQYGTLLTRVHGRGKASLATAERQFVRAVKEGPAAMAQQRYAAFLRFDKKDYRAAEQAYQASLADDELPATLCGYASLLDLVRGDYDQAQDLYKKARPSGQCVALYARFLRRVRKDFVAMADLVADAEAAATDTKLQSVEWDSAKLWHSMHTEGGLESGMEKCLRVGLDAVRFVACVLLTLAHVFSDMLRGQPV